MFSRKLFSICGRFSNLKVFLIGLSVLSLYLIASPIQKIFTYYHTPTDVKFLQSKIETKVLVDPVFYNYLISNLYGSKYAGVENYTNYYVAQYGLKTLDQIQPILPGLGPVINDYTSFQHPINIHPCVDQVHFNKTSIFIAVVSAPGNFEQRQTVRHTWRKHLKSDIVADLINLIGFAFLMGRTKDKSMQAAIEKENRNNSDIIQVDMVDSYKNLTLKTVSLLNWVFNYCPGVQFVLKVDDDVYVNVRNLAATIRSLPPSDKSIYGRLSGGNSPARKGSKWSYTYEMWPWNRIPKFIAGGAYLISGSSVAPLLASAQTTPFFVSEDLYISGLCNRKVNVTIHSSANMFVYSRPKGKPDACFVKETTTWLTDSISWMNKSNELTQQFYGNKISCLTENNTSLSINRFNTDGSTHSVASTFTLVLNPDQV